MASPLVHLENLMRERAELESRIEAMEAGSNETHRNYESTTENTVESLRERLANLDEEIVKVGAPQA